MVQLETEGCLNTTCQITYVTSLLSDNVPRGLPDGDLHRLPSYPIYISQCAVWKSRTGKLFNFSNSGY